jgi:positive regulator of sigma E activity
MEDTGIVKSVEAGIAKVEMQRSKACKSCGACVATGPETMEVKAEDTIGVKTGETVRVEVADAVVLKAIGLLYGIPALIFTVILILSISFIHLPEYAGAILGFIAMVPVYMLLSRYIKSRFPEQNIRPRIIGRK